MGEILLGLGIILITYIIYGIISLIIEIIKFIIEIIMFIVEQPKLIINNHKRKKRTQKKLYNEAIELDKRGEYVMALKKYNQVKNSMKNVKDLIKRCEFKYANQLLSEGKYKEAAEKFKELGEFRYTGEAYEKMGNYKLAKKYYKKAKLDEFDEII